MNAATFTEADVYAAAKHLAIVEGDAWVFEPPKMDGDTTVAGNIVAEVWPFWQLRGHLHEGRRWLEHLLEAVPESTPLRAQLLWIAGILATKPANHTWLIATFRIPDVPVLGKGSNLFLQ